MDYEKQLDACEKYIYQVYQTEKLFEMGVPGMYGVEQQRIYLHEQLCDAFEIDRIKSKDILSYLDKYIGLDINADLDEGNLLSVYAKKLCKILNDKKEELSV